MVSFVTSIEQTTKKKMAHRAYYVEKIFLKGLLVVGAYTLSLRIMRRTNFRDYTSKFEPYRPAFERGRRHSNELIYKTL